VVSLDPNQTQSVTSGNPTVSVSPVGQLSTAAYVLLAGSLLTLNGQSRVAYYLSCTTHNVTFTIKGSLDGTNWFVVEATDQQANALLADIAVVVGTAQMAVLAPPNAGSVFQYYQVYLKDTAGGTHGTGTVVGFSS